MNNIINNQQLIEYIKCNKKVKFELFWGHRSSSDGPVDKSCLSQWFAASFVIDGIHYKTAEHYMMAEKARLFSDEKILKQILMAKNPGAAKALGRKVENFDEQKWVDHRFDIVYRTNMAKFSQNLHLKSFLLKTGHKILVETSPVDRIWGIGMASDDKNVYQPQLWKGLNLLGYALMKVRADLV